MGLREQIKEIVQGVSLGFGLVGNFPVYGRDRVGVDRLMALIPQWRPIETAPKDGTKVDLWVEYNWRGNIHRYRLTDAYWYGKAWVFQPWIAVAGDEATAAKIEQEGSESNASIKATHWMPTPEPPECEATDAHTAPLNAAVG